MTIGIMGAMPEEVDIIRELMTDISQQEHGSRIYYSGKINQHDVVLVFSRWGKVAAAATVASLIHQFKIEQLIFTGVAGAVAPHLNIGDIVISQQLFQHDMNATPLFKRHEIPLTGITYFNTDKQLTVKAKVACENLLKNTKDHFPPETLLKFGISKPQYALGIIGSGDQFISSLEQSENILIEKPETLAVEMEGAAVAQVCYDHNIPFIVIRTISDQANHKAHLDFPAFVNEIAKYYSKTIIQDMLKSL